MHAGEASRSATPGVQVAAYAGEEKAWDDFVQRSPGATFFHRIGWKDVLEQAFGFRSRYLVARRGTGVVGVLPMCLLSQSFGGTCLLSLPFAVEAGICAADGEAQRALEAAALELGRSSGARYLELRDGLEGDGFSVRQGSYFRFRRPFGESDEENLLAVPRKQRRMIRLGQRSGLVARIGTEQLATFHDLYARSVRRLGTPVFARSYFRLLCERFGDACELLTIYRGETPAAAVLSFFFRGAVIPYYAGSRRELYRYGVNDLLYWELMRHARRRGMHTFDFGRSKAGTGAFAYKQHWGFAPEPLRYRVHACGGGDVPERSLGDGPVALLRRGWSRLPLWATKLLGPPIVRRFGAYYT